MTPVKIGIIGCGTIGTHHMECAVVSDDIELIAAADLDEGALRRAAEKYRIPNAYGSAAELLDNPEVEAVVLALITGVRGAVAINALEERKHVLLEKPPAMNVGELRQMKAIQGDRVIACCSARFAYSNGAQRARQIVESGLLGEIRVVRCKGISPVAPLQEGCAPPPWRVSHALNGGGYMVNWGVYDLCVVRVRSEWRLVKVVILGDSCAASYPFGDVVW